MCHLLANGNNNSLDMSLSWQDEVIDIAKKLFASDLQLLVIDTENKFVSTGFAEEIANAAKGRYYYLPNASEQAIAATAAGALLDAKGS